MLEINNSNCNRPGSGEDIPKRHLPVLLAISYFNDGPHVIGMSPEISCSKEEKGGNVVPARGGAGVYLLEQDLPLSWQLVRTPCKTGQTENGMCNQAVPHPAFLVLKLNLTPEDWRWKGHWPSVFLSPLLPYWMHLFMTLSLELAHYGWIAKHSLIGFPGPRLPPSQLWWYNLLKLINKNLETWRSNKTETSWRTCDESGAHTTSDEALIFLQLYLGATSTRVSCTASDVTGREALLLLLLHCHQHPNVIQTTAKPHMAGKLLGFFAFQCVKWHQRENFIRILWK